MALLLLTFVAPLQMFPSIMEFVGRDTDGGTTFGIFGVAWSRRPDIAFRRRQTKRYDRTFFDKTGRVFPCADAADFDEQTAAWTLLGISVFRTLEMLPLNSNWASHISCNWHNRTRAMRESDYAGFVFLFAVLHLKPTPPTLRNGNGRRAIQGCTEDRISHLMREVEIHHEL